MKIKPIARFRSPFSSKFGAPKQSGLVDELHGDIVFEPQYRDADYLRGLDGFDYIWLIWEFSANRHTAHSPVVRPPLLGGNERIGVFATRSPYRPNGLGLSSVRILSIETTTDKGPIIHVAGADLIDGTPIYDIKPYITYADSHENVCCGFVDATPIQRLTVEIDADLAKRFTSEELRALIKTLELDPRPHYQNDSQKVYGMPFGDYDVHFSVHEQTLTVVSLSLLSKDDNKESGNRKSR